MYLLNLALHCERDGSIATIRHQCTLLRGDAGNGGMKGMSILRMMIKVKNEVNFAKRKQAIEMNVWIPYGAIVIILS